MAEDKKIETSKAPSVPNWDMAFAEAVTGQIGSDRHHGWGLEDSCAVIESLVAEALPQGQTPSDEMMSKIRLVVNPSAFRQMLEKAKRPDGQTVLAESAGKRINKGLELYSK